MLFIVRGAPGSGKSTFAKTRFLDAVHLEADQFFISYNGVYNWYADGVRFAHAWCQSQTYYNLALGRNVVVSNTFTRLWELRPYFDIAEMLTVDVDVYYCTGEYTNVHNVPEHIVRRMRREYQSYEKETVV